MPLLLPESVSDRDHHVIFHHSNVFGGNNLAVYCLIEDLNILRRKTCDIRYGLGVRGFREII